MDLERVSSCLKDKCILGYANLALCIGPDFAFLNAAEGGTLDLEYVNSCLAVMIVFWAGANLGNRAGCASPNDAEHRMLDLNLC